MRKYRAKKVGEEKFYEGFPVESMTGKTYLIVLFDDYEPAAIRIGYIEIIPETLKKI